VIAGVAELPVGAAAGLFAGGVGDGVGVIAVQARDGVAAAAVAYMLSTAVLSHSRKPESSVFLVFVRFFWSYDVACLARRW
jgi:hypothetical protein